MSRGLNTQVDTGPFPTPFRPTLQPDTDHGDASSSYRNLPRFQIHVKEDRRIMGTPTSQPRTSTFPSHLCLRPGTRDRVCDTRRRVKHKDWDTTRERGHTITLPLEDPDRFPTW